MAAPTVLGPEILVVVEVEVEVVVVRAALVVSISVLEHRFGLGGSSCAFKVRH